MTLSKRIFAVLLSVFILFMSFGNCIYSVNSISRVYAAEVAAGAVAEGAYELVLLLLSEFGVGLSLASNEDAFDFVLDTYVQHLDAQLEFGEWLVDGTKSIAMNIYDSVTGAVRSIPFDECIDALKGFHDTAVDNLTGIYAQYCPELIGFTRDFAHDLADGSIVIEGFNDNVYLGNKEIDAQWSGEAFDYSGSIRFVCQGVDSKDKYYYYSQTYNFCNSVFGPICGYLNLTHAPEERDFKIIGLNKYGIPEVFSFDVSCESINIRDGETFVSTGDISTYDFFMSGTPILTYVVNFPVFNSFDLCKDYLLGIADVTGAINWDGVIDNDDLPFWGLSRALAEAIARAPDIGIGSIGAGSLVNEWADDIPFVGLTDLQDYIDNVNRCILLVGLAAY